MSHTKTGNKEKFKGHGMDYGIDECTLVVATPYIFPRGLDFFSSLSVDDEYLRHYGIDELIESLPLVGRKLPF